MTKSCYPNAIELIDVLFDFVITEAAKAYLRMDIGQVSMDLADKINIQTSIQLSNFRISIDTHGIRHILYKHGNSESEALRGQLSVQKRNLWLIPHIIDFSDIIQSAGKSSLGNDVILIEKTIKDYRYCTIWEVRAVKSVKKQTTKNSRIMLHTFYIRPI
jgi:hypothetical protein